jgi:hypothetical protein
MSEQRISRRRWIAYSAGIGAGLYVLGAFTDRSAAPPCAQLVLPPGLPTLTAQRLQNLHSRYSTLRAASGVAAVRQRIIADLHGYRGFDDWVSVIIDWIDLAGWNDAADLIVDAAELGGVVVRRNAAANLAGRKSALLIANGYQPRIIRLHKTETDPAAAADWALLRKSLGI